MSHVGVLDTLRKGTSLFYMKTSIIIMVLAVGGVLQGMAADTAILSKAVNKQKMTVQFANRFTFLEKASSSRIDRVGGVSSRPWTQIAFNEADGSPVFKDPITHKCQLHLFWIGAEPQP